MKTKTEEIAKEKALFWAFLAPSITFIVILIVNSKYSLVASGIIWLLAASMYVMTYKQKKVAAKAFALYSLPVLVIAIFITVIAVAVGAQHV